MAPVVEVKMTIIVSLISGPPIESVAIINTTGQEPSFQLRLNTVADLSIS